MARSERRTATYDAAVIEAVERVKTSAEYRRALGELAGHEPDTDSALFNALARIALDLIERRALELGYRQLADSAATDHDDVDGFLERAALAGFEYDADEDPGPLLEFLAGGSR